MRAMIRIAAVACLTLAVALPAGAETYERTQTDTYTGFATVHAAGQYAGLMGQNAWFDYQVFPAEHTVSVQITDVSGRPVAGVVTQFVDFPSTYVSFCGTVTVPVTWTDEDTQTVFVNPILGDGPAGCETSLPVRGTIVATITGTY